MAGGVRGSFRQAMSEMFMGGDNSKDAERKPDRAATRSSDSPEIGGDRDSSVGAASSSMSASGAGDYSRDTDTGAAATRMPVSDTAEAQVAQMSRDISGGELVDDAMADPEDKGADGRSGTASGGGGRLNFREMIAADFGGSGGGDDFGGDGDFDPSDGEGGARTPQRITVIAEGTEISGDVKFASKAEVYGTINATVESANDIIANTGSITGNVVAKNIEMLDSEIKGDVATAGDIRLNTNSVLTGEVNANRMDLRGQIIGDTVVKGELNVHNTARLQGDIEAGSIAIGHGARIKGFLNIEGVNDGSGAVIGSQTEIAESDAPEEAPASKE